MKLGVQLYSVRDDMAQDFEGTLKKVKAMGYEGVEFAGLYGKSAEEVKALCAKYELEPVSAHVSLGEMRDDPFVIETYAAIGCKFIAIPWLNEEDRPGHENGAKTIGDAAILGAVAKKNGMKLFRGNQDNIEVELQADDLLIVFSNH